MDAPGETVKLVLMESERLTQYLTTLSPESWRAPSACDRWEVRDVVTHLAAQAEDYAAWITRSLQGDVAPPADRPAPGSANAASYGERGVQPVIARRERLGDQVFADFLTANDQLNRLLASISPQDWEKPHYYTSLGIAPLRFRPVNRLIELTIHSWDIRSRFEPDAHLTAECIPVIVDMTFGPLLTPPSWLFHPGPRLPVALRYRWVLTGVGAREQDIVVTGDTVRVEPAGSTAATVTFRGDTETFALLMCGRLPLPDALAQCRLTARGEVEQVDAFAQWFRGV